MPRKPKLTNAPDATGDEPHESAGATATMVAEPPVQSPKRRRRTKTTEAEVATSDAQQQPIEAAVVTPPAAVVEPMSPIASASPPVREEPPFEPTGRYTPSESPSDAGDQPRGQFRSWVTDTARGYTRLSDEQHQRIVVQFATRPSADVLTALKGAGFQFQPDYQGQKNAWVRQNNYEGRLQIEAIEKLFQESTRGAPSPTR